MTPEEQEKDSFGWMMRERALRQAIQVALKTGRTGCRSGFHLYLHVSSLLFLRMMVVLGSSRAGDGDVVI